MTKLGEIIHTSFLKMPMEKNLNLNSCFFERNLISTTFFVQVILVESIGNNYLSLNIFRMLLIKIAIFHTLRLCFLSSVLILGWCEEQQETCRYLSQINA